MTNPAHKPLSAYMAVRLDKRLTNSHDLLKEAPGSRFYDHPRKPPHNPLVYQRRYQHGTTAHAADVVAGRRPPASAEVDHHLALNPARDLAISDACYGSHREIGNDHEYL